MSNPEETRSSDPATKTKQFQRTSNWPKGVIQHVATGAFYVRTTSAGKTRTVPLKTKLITIARIRATEENAKVERIRKAARNVESGIGKMADLAKVYRAQIAARFGISDKTKQILCDAVRFIEKTWPGEPAAFETLHPSAITPSAVEKWKSHALTHGTGFKPPGSKGNATVGRSASSFNKAVDALRRMLDLAVDSALIHANPLAGRRGLKASDRPRKPNLPEVATLQAVFAEIERPGGRCVGTAEFCRFLAFTGCRKSEAAAVRWQDVDMVRGVLRVRGTKTEAAAREVPLIPPARQLLEKIRARREAAATVEKDGKPYVSEKDAVLMVREAQISLTRACKVVKCERLTHHDLRDAFATVCIERGVDVPTVAGWLGHADGGALLMRVYAHHRRAHSVTQAAKVDF
jgi:integrase